MIKNIFSNLLRKVKLIYWADLLRFQLHKIKNKKSNAAFKKAHPEIPIPPDYLMYESFGLNYATYYFDGKETAQWLLDHISRHIEFENLNILDWGCGPGRIVRHLPDLLGNKCRYFGTDYNADSIKWCKANLPNIQFNNNSIEAELSYKDETFDVIYGYSIFTHLSEKKHYEWFFELYRVLKKGGVMFLTTHGNNYRVKLTESEKADFDKGMLIERGMVKEGHRTYTAFQPIGFMNKLFQNVSILEHIEQPIENLDFIPQDIWIVKK